MNISQALTGFFIHLVPEAVLGLAACVLFLGATFRASRHVWAAAALLALAGAGVALGVTAANVPTVEVERAGLEDGAGEEVTQAREALAAKVYAAPVLFSQMALLLKIVSLVGGAVLVLVTWNEVGDEHAAEFHGCLLVLVSGMCLTGAANDLVTLFLALELVSIPTYVMLYLPRTDATAQEAAMKYFLLSVFSSGLLLFGFSYLYGVTGTTNIPGVTEALATAGRPGPWQGLALVALVMVVAGLGFRIAAVPFHFYAPDVYQGTTTGMAALLAFAPKVVGFAGLLRVLGFVPPVVGGSMVGGAMGEQVPVLLWIMAAVTMSLGNILALLQDNLKRMLAYSSVAHAGYMLIGLAVAPRLPGAPGEAVGGVEAVLFYLVGYGAMTIGAFAVMNHLSTAGRPVENVDDLAGLGKSHSGVALMMAVFLFSLIGIPLTAGFMGKFFLFFDAMGLSASPAAAGLSDALRAQLAEHARLYRVLALIGSINAAVGAWYYLRILSTMYLREGVEPLPPARPAPVLGAIWVCLVLTLGLGVYPNPLLKMARDSVPHRTAAGLAAGRAAELSRR
jgi:NADH-quinone oxidoreductase subunit N